MAQYIPDNTTAYEADLDNLMQLAQGNGVFGGLAVTAQSSPNMTVQVGAGTIQFRGIMINVSAIASLVISAADPTNARIDMVTIDTNGTVAMTNGTPSATPKPASLAANRIFIAYVSVAAAAVNIQNSNISDRRLYVPAMTSKGDINPTNAPWQGLLRLRDETGSLQRYDNATSVWQDVSREMPNLIPNSDFARRTVWGLAMPEAFSDTNGYFATSGAPTVASNILTFNAANNILIWPKAGSDTFWRDGRVSATFKAITTGANTYDVRWHYVDSNNYMWASQNGNGSNTFSVWKRVAGANTLLFSAANTLTINRWYWIDIETQGSSWTAKIYDTASTAPGVAKPATPMIPMAVGSTSGDVLIGGCGITSDLSNAQWGGISASPGGVYVETWLPESWAVVWLGTLGGQAITYDEAVNSGPMNKQWAIRGYVPHIARSMRMQSNGYTWNAKPSTYFTSSIYAKASGIGGAGTILYNEVLTADQGNANAHSTTASLFSGADAAWTRKGFTGVVNAADSTWFYDIYWNVGLDTTGAGYIQCLQIEEGSLRTGWRNAPQDDAPMYIVNHYTQTTDIQTTSTSLVDLEPRSMAASFLAPWDCTARLEFQGGWYHGTLAAYSLFDFTLDGNTTLSGSYLMQVQEPVVNNVVALNLGTVIPVTAGKHRISFRWRVTAGTGNIFLSSGQEIQFRIILTRGK